MSKCMGIDYGARRVGVALSDDGQHFAFAHGVLENNDQLLESLAALAKKEGVGAYVVGESDNPAGGMNTIQRRIMIFNEALQKRTDLPVHTLPEHYSTAEARRALKEKVRSRKNTKVAVDAAAAAIILQTYLDQMRAEST